MFTRTRVAIVGGALAALALLLFLSAMLTAEAAPALQDTAPEVAPEAGRPHRAGLRSRIVSVHGSALTINHDGEQLIILVDEETEYRIAGDVSPSLDDLDIGDIVHTRLAPQADFTLRATFIAREPRGDRIVGQVREVGDDRFTIRLPRRGMVDVTVDETTIVVAREEELRWHEGGAALLLPGANVAAFGTGNLKERTMAAEVLIILRYPRPRPVTGSIIAVDGNSFTLETRNGTIITVITDEQTRFRHPDLVEPELGDFTVGDTVVVLGRPTGEERVRAHVVALR